MLMHKMREFGVQKSGANGINEYDISVIILLINKIIASNQNEDETELPNITVGELFGVYCNFALTDMVNVLDLVPAFRKKYRNWSKKYGKVTALNIIEFLGDQAENIDKSELSKVLPMDKTLFDTVSVEHLKDLKELLKNPQQLSLVTILTVIEKLIEFAGDFIYTYIETLIKGKHQQLDDRIGIIKKKLCDRENIFNKAFASKVLSEYNQQQQVQKKRVQKKPKQLKKLLTIGNEHSEIPEQLERLSTFPYKYNPHSVSNDEMNQQWKLKKLEQKIKKNKRKIKSDKENAKKIKDKYWRKYRQAELNIDSFKRLYMLAANNDDLKKLQDNLAEYRRNIDKLTGREYEDQLDGQNDLVKVNEVELKNNIRKLEHSFQQNYVKCDQSSGSGRVFSDAQLYIQNNQQIYKDKIDNGLDQLNKQFNGVHKNLAKLSKLCDPGSDIDKLKKRLKNIASNCKVDNNIPDEDDFHESYVIVALEDQRKQAVIDQAKITTNRKCHTRCSQISQLEKQINCYSPLWKIRELEFKKTEYQNTYSSLRKKQQNMLEVDRQAVRGEQARCQSLPLFTADNDEFKKQHEDFESLCRKMENKEIVDIDKRLESLQHDIESGCQDINDDISKFTAISKEIQIKGKQISLKRSIKEQFEQSVQKKLDKFTSKFVDKKGNISGKKMDDFERKKGIKLDQLMKIFLIKLQQSVVEAPLLAGERISKLQLGQMFCDVIRQHKNITNLMAMEKDRSLRQLKFYRKYSLGKISGKKIQKFEALIANDNASSKQVKFGNVVVTRDANYQLKAKVKWSNYSLFSRASSNARKQGKLEQFADNILHEINAQTTTSTI